MTAPIGGWCDHEEDPRTCPICQPLNDPWALDLPARPPLVTRLWTGDEQDCRLCPEPILVGDPITVHLKSPTPPIPPSTITHTACRPPRGLSA